MSTTPENCPCPACKKARAGQSNGELSHDHGKAEVEADYRGPRQPGDARHRCLWCGHWRCQKPLALCPSCQASYERMAVGMPSRTWQRERA